MKQAFVSPRFNQNFFRLVALLWILTLSGENLLADAPRERTLLDAGWRFNLGDPADLANPSETNVAYYPEISDLAKLTLANVAGPTSETNLMTLRPPLAGLGENVSFVQTNFNDSSWRAINLPHDWIVELPFTSGGDTGHGSKAGINGTTSSNTIAWYRHTFTMPSSYTNQTLWLEFDGVYRNCLVWLNGHILGRDVSGYSGFSFDVTKYANPGGANVLVVRVDASRFEGWFYEGAGIYRHVWLVKTAPVHIAHWGTFVTNIVSGTNATVTIRSQVNNDSSNAVTCTLISAIYGSDSNLVVTASQSLSVAAGASNIVSQTVTLTNARLWSLDHPNLYQLTSTVVQSGITNDVYQTPFGVRTIAWDPNNGLLLNGQRVEIQGMCNHQDHAGVGIAVPDRIQYFRVEVLKAMGCNVYRTSHNAPAPETVDACDQLGMLMLDENRRVGPDAESLGQLQRGIIRDRNHPSVFAWSLGNEEKFIQGTSTGAVVIAAMQNLAHQLDPTRLCTVAMNGSWGSGFSTVIDIQGFNYLHVGNMDSFHTSFPNLPTMGTEDGSCYYTRGIYTNSSTYKTAYDVNIPSYGQTAESWWKYYTARPWNAGACYWTGFDYRGEPSPFGWPNISSEFGTIDTCGFPKDTFYYYQANWTGKKVVHLFPHWNWSSGQVVDVWCFSDCDSVELFLNGVSQGRQTTNMNSHFEWHVSFAAGTLQAVGYINGNPAMTNTEVTTGTPAGISLQPDRKTILSDGRDVSLVTVTVVDAQGRVVPTATNTINFSISGGAIIGVGNGDPICHEADKTTNNIWSRSLFSGLAQVIVQSTNAAGSIVLSATATGLSSTGVTITAAVTLPPPASPAGLFAVSSNALVSLSWNDVPGALSYNVKRSTVSGGPYLTVSSGSPDGYYTDTGVRNGTTYFYVVSAVNTDGESSNSVEVSVLPGVQPPSIVSQPVSITNTSAMYAGVPITFSATIAGGQPFSYQWYQIVGGVTNLVAGATDATFTHFSQPADTNGPAGFFVVVSNGSGSVTSSVANLVLTGIVPGAPGTISVQLTVTNYSGYSGGFYPAPTDTAGVYAVSNWNVWPITPSSGSGTQAGVTFINLDDRLNVQTPISLTVVNASDGWHQTQFVTNTDTANARMMNTFWKVNPAKSSPSTNILRLTFTNVPEGVYSAYIYLMQNTGSPTGMVYSAGGTTNFFREFTKYNSSSNFVTAVDVAGVTNPFVNYVKLTGLGTGNTHSIALATAWIGGGDGIGVCGIQLVPAIILQAGPRTNGQFNFLFPAPAGQSYVVEMSTNLANWISVLTNTPANGAFVFFDTNLTVPSRFYRIRQ